MFTEPEHSSPLEPGRHRSSNYAVFVLFVCIWYICNAIAGIKTKVALVDTHDNWAFIELSFCQSVIGTMMAVALVQVRKFLSRLWRKQNHPDELETTNNWVDDEDPTINWKITVIAVCHALGNVLTNVGIHLIGTSRTQVLKVAEPVCTVILTKFLTPKEASIGIPTLVAIGMICSGLVVTAWSHQQFTMAGVIVMFVSNLALPLRNISIKHVSTIKEHMDHSMLFLLMVRRSLLWFSGALILKQVITGKLTLVNIDFIWSSVLTNGYHMSSLLCLEFIDPITHSIANVFKRAFTIVSALVYFHEVVQIPTLIGLEVAFVGLFLYAQAKLKQIDIMSLIKSATIMALVLIVGWMIVQNGGVVEPGPTNNGSSVSPLPFFSIPNGENSKPPTIDLQNGEDVKPLGPTNNHSSLSPSKGFLRVKTWRWSVDNFGDALGPVILQRLLSRTCNCEVETLILCHAPRLMTIGSIFHFITSGDVSWGSGIRDLQQLKRKKEVGKLIHSKKFRVLYMRGPRSFRGFHELYDSMEYTTFPEIYGDPGLLFGCLFPEYLPTNRSNSSSRQPLFISHLSLLNQLQSVDSLDGVSHLNAFSPWQQVVEAISSSSFVLSGSLHGLIIAESLGIPARFVRQGLKSEPFFKFHDYYEGTGRKFEDVAETIQDALKIGGVKEKPRFDPEAITKLLIDSLPDLVKRGIVQMSPSCSCTVPKNFCHQNFFVN
eukprot:TRINITY_DN992_c0_g1_i4.p1 TRINITY_DN992_c0_g1~~TRINITY_DN992_c0_g1_i4.p1  ORF type:complete len:715 (+),score=87.09 TRINITY_DN992_c0_g1_i4:30-2174(+)